jgi:hypothetical protein
LTCNASIEESGVCWVDRRVFVIVPEETISVSLDLALSRIRTMASDRGLIVVFLSTTVILWVLWLHIWIGWKVGAYMAWYT